MHPNPVFRQADRAEALADARARGFGTLMRNGDPVPMVAHVPFLLSGDGGTADLHLTRSNPLGRTLDAPCPALIAVAGPDGYVSPDWYGVADQVPTWNYVALHLVGRLEKRPEAELPGLLDRLSEHFESRLAPKPLWRTTKLEPDSLARMLRMIVPFRFHVEEIRSTYKLSQNKPDDARIAAARAMAASGFGQEVAALSTLMEEPPKS
ncbi:FMN-binding negative transcriptional regulator [Frigidibacter sp. ROC022]|uniref:FMN-binding negative transcriptional regulator n=1 Tax=Frigidibacter sp. ROC022 TaxID=2971796 RepID=UPI00215B37E5|nr:FMN-binding negative transcriptional regulator [Frigidibacter sp. ROC022]MCR8724727.1 FMN-binding negative transcriptional regulator [Frigidibacter sp. ROC022]